MKLLIKAIRRILKPSKLQFAFKYFKNKPIRVLDLGCGNDSFEITKFHLNLKEYIGVDNTYWNSDKSSYLGIDKLIIMDLDKKPNFKLLKNNYFDFIIMNHVIEHLNNGEKVLKALFKKLKIGGIIYIETPDISTLNNPSAIGFLNFYDDKTHRRIYEIKSLVSFLSANGYKIVKYGRRRDFKRILIFSPWMILYNFFYSIPFLRKIDSRGLWDLLGVASFVIVTKEKT